MVKELKKTVIEQSKQTTLYTDSLLFREILKHVDTHIFVCHNIKMHFGGLNKTFEI